MRQAARTRAFLANTRVVTVRCARCEARGGLLFTTDSHRGLDGLTWDGATWAKVESGSGAPHETLGRERTPGYHSHHRYSCQRCGTPWPTDDVVTAKVRQAEELGRRMVIL